MPVSYKDQVRPLLEPLPAMEREVLRNILITYNTDDAGTQLMTTLRKIDSLGTSIVDGYVSVVLGVDKLSENSKKFNKWRKNLQKHICYLASPTGGRDRQAIALAYFRDFVMTTDRTEKLENLEGCRTQLLDLYNTIAPYPFEW